MPTKFAEEIFVTSSGEVAFVSGAGMQWPDARAAVLRLND